MVIITFLRIRNKKLSLKQMFKIFKKPDVKAKLYHQVLYNWALLLSQCSTAVCASVWWYMREVAGSNPATGNFLNILNIKKTSIYNYYMTPSILSNKFTLGCCFLTRLLLSDQQWWDWIFQKYLNTGKLIFFCC